jgi:hypothetical protein
MVLMCMSLGLWRWVFLCRFTSPSSCFYHISVSSQYCPSYRERSATSDVAPTVLVLYRNVIGVTLHPALKGVAGRLRRANGRSATNSQHQLKVFADFFFFLNARRDILLLINLAQHGTPPAPCLGQRFET